MVRFREALQNENWYTPSYLNMKAASKKHGIAWSVKIIRGSQNGDRGQPNFQTTSSQSHTNGQLTSNAALEESQDRMECSLIGEMDGLEQGGLNESRENSDGGH